MEYLDMFLVHWPAKLKSCACYPVPAEEASECLDMESIWAGMERCVELGLCKCIGLSKFSCNKIDLLLQRASIPPAVNQILNVVSFCHLQGIVHRDLKPKVIVS
ncbi:hypothetical protein MRB53_006784 [Persea americana]|uniref:Uncharacterized protein n=1 Tax=Persea americana TaxID=3435 RepID=A0ACC2MI20_PERAE|nr:hypothetical protein MRB53_006784 [Persea americana]